MVGEFELKVFEKMGRKLIDHKNTCLYNRISECFQYFRLLNNILNTQPETSVHQSPRVNLTEQVWGQLGDQLWNLINH